MLTLQLQNCMHHIPNHILNLFNLPSSSLEQFIFANARKHTRMIPYEKASPCMHQEMRCHRRHVASPYIFFLTVTTLRQTQTQCRDPCPLKTGPPFLYISTLTTPDAHKHCSPLPFTLTTKLRTTRGPVAACGSLWCVDPHL